MHTQIHTQTHRESTDTDTHRRMSVLFVWYRVGREVLGQERDGLVDGHAGVGDGWEGREGKWGRRGRGVYTTAQTRRRHGVAMDQEAKAPGGGRIFT